MLLSQFIDSGYLVCETPPSHLKLYRCFGHGLKMCMLFGYSPQIIFVPFLQVEQSFFRRYYYQSE